MSRSLFFLIFAACAGPGLTVDRKAPIQDGDDQQSFLADDYESTDVILFPDVPSVQEGNLEAGVSDFYFLSVPEGHDLIMVAGSQIDTVGTLFTLDADVVATDDDSGEGFNFSMVAEDLMGELYVLRVDGYDASVEGDYRLDLLAVDASGPDEVALDGDVRVDAADQPDVWWEGSIQEIGDTQRVRIELAESSSPRLSVRSHGNLDTIAALLNADFETIATDDDSGQDLNFYMEAYGAGVYYLDIALVDGTGEFMVFIGANDE